MSDAVGPGRRDGDHRVARLDEGERAMEEVGGRIGVGREAGQFLELERQFPGRRVFEAPRDDDQPVAVREPAGNRHSLGLRRERRGERVGDGSQRRLPVLGRPEPRLDGRRRASRARAARRCRSSSRRQQVRARPAGRSWWSAAATRSESASFVSAIVGAPWRRAAARTPTMSGDCPDCEMPITSERSSRGSVP